MFPPKKYPKTSIRHLGKGYRFWVDRQFEHHYDAYICNSDYTRKWLCKVWNVKGKDEMIYPPVFSGAFQEERYQEWKKENIILDVMLSEEGGRFYHEQNRNVVMFIEWDMLKSLPEGYIWVNYSTLNLLVQINNCLNIQLRNLLSTLEM